MSVPQPHGEKSGGIKRTRTLAKAGIGLSAGLCVALLVVSAVEKVRDAGDRTH